MLQNLIRNVYETHYNYVRLLFICIDIEDVVLFEYDRLAFVLFLYMYLPSRSCQEVKKM